MADSNVTFELESAGLPGVELLVRTVRVTEALNEPYRVEITFTPNDPDAPLADMLGQDCVLQIERGDRIRRVVGIVRHVEEGEQAEFRLPRCVFVPALWMLGLRRNTRIFQEKTTVEILEDVLDTRLGPYSRSIANELAESYPRREYCVQYQETDLEFVHRLMEEEGIHYAFDHEGEQEVLILRDANEQHPEVPTGKLVEYQPHNFVITDKEPIVQFRRRLTSTTTSVVLNDWDWTQGTMPIEIAQSSPDELGRERESYEHGEGRSLQLWDYDAGVRSYQQNDAPTQSFVRLETHNRDRLVGEGYGRVISMAPGQRFEITGHPAIGIDGEYILLRVEHLSRSLGAVIEGSGEADAYYNRFECIPADVPYHPRRETEKPSVPGIQTAVVTGPAGEEIHTDEYGRIKVQFHWDREGQNDEHSSCWIRVQQPWAGAGWGFWYLPRIGMEVIVHFVDGDPDRPLVTGCVYNANNLPPYPLPDEKTKSTIKSNSSIGGGGFNEFRFEDKKGEEEIYTHAQKDYNEVVENDHNTLVHHDQSNTVDNNQTQLVKRDQTEMVHGDQSMTVDGNRTLVIHSNYDETVDGTETRTVTGNVEETFDSNETRSITGNVTEEISGNETRTILGDHTEEISGNETLQQIGGSTHNITGSLDQSVTGGISVTTPANVAVTAVGGFSVTAAGGIKLTAAGGITFAAPGGAQMVDTFWEWKGVFKFESGAFEMGYTHIKDEFAGVTYEAIGLKGELEVINATMVGVNYETKGLAIMAPAMEMRTGAVRLGNGVEMA